tara:strand:- start:39 stop:413 length:375 start_codon:yes stop_codon:yes gene_type:complete
MKMKLKEIKKLYYSIGDVSEITGLKQYVLRFWETEFSVLKPGKNKAGNRIYKDKDIKVIRHIKSLLYDKKYTIKGAKQYMIDHYSNEQNNTKVLKISNANDEKLLIDLKAKLQESLDLINKLKS